MKEVINSPDAPAPIGPYSHAVRAGNLLFVSGQIALDAGGKLLNDSIEEETKQVLRNIEFILKRAGLGWENIVKTTIFLTDLANFVTVNELYGSMFYSNYPARETVEVSRLPKDVSVEISVVAVYPD